MIRKGSRLPRKVYKAGREVHWLTKGERTIYMSPSAARTATKAWLDANAVTRCVIEEDSAGRWFEMEVDLPDTFTGDAEEGWTDGVIRVGLHWSDNLTAWLGAGNGWIDAPGKSPLSLGGGRKRFYARYETSAVIRFSALIDQRLTTSRHGKSITACRVFNAAVSLPNFPYEMPADAAQLQTDLRAAGYTGATVSTATGGWSAKIGDYNVAKTTFVPTWSGSDITALTAGFGGSSVSLPNFPYTMPGDEAQLEADLEAAGYDYPQVTLYKDEWEVFLPDLNSTGTERRFEFDITPADPVQLWTFNGLPNGIRYQTLLSGTPENIRVSGTEVSESLRAFARLGFINQAPPA